MKKNFKLIGLLIKIKLMKQMMYRESFLGSFLVNISLFITQILLFNTIYSQFDSIAGWTRYQMMFFIGTYTLINSISMMLYYFGIMSVPQLVRNGKLDLFIIRPCNSLLYVSFSSFDLGSIPMVLVSLIILFYSASKQNLSVEFFNIMLYIVTIVLMTVLYYDLLVLVRCVSFYTIDISGLERIEWSFTELTMKIPGTIFKGFLKIVLCILLPYGIVATIPSYLFFNSFNWRVILYSFLITNIFTWITFKVWNFSIRHYRSASS